MTVGHPSRVHIVVLTRCYPENLVASRPDYRVGASSAINVDTFGLFQEPNPHLEAEVVRGESSHRANIRGVE